MGKVKKPASTEKVKSHGTNFWNMHVRVDEFDKEKGIWHVSMKLKHDGKNTFNETVCPKDIFAIMFETYSAVLNQIRMIHDNTEELRNAYEGRDVKAINKIVDQYITVFSGNGFRNKKKPPPIAKGGKNMIDFFSRANAATRESATPKSMLEKTAFALVLAGRSFEDVERQIDNLGNFELEIPINDYADLASIRGNQSEQFLSMLDNSLGIVRNVFLGS